MECKLSVCKLQKLLMSKSLYMNIFKNKNFSNYGIHIDLQYLGNEAA